MDLTPLQLKLAPDVPDLAALGARHVEDLLAWPPRLETSDRIERVGSLLRIPLPGTPDRQGRQHEAPRGAGTGYLIARRYGGGSEGLRARVTPPHSSSLAARDWNVSCHLQANGVTTPLLVAIVERTGAITASESVVITRELEGFTPFRSWLATEVDRDARARGLKSLGLACAALLRCGARLPRTSPENIMIQVRASEDCAALQITNLGAEQALLRERSLVRGRLPTIAFTEFGQAAIRAKSLESLRAFERTRIRDQLLFLLRSGETFEIPTAP